MLQGSMDQNKFMFPPAIISFNPFSMVAVLTYLTLQLIKEVNILNHFEPKFIFQFAQNSYRPIHNLQVKKDNLGIY